MTYFAVEGLSIQFGGLKAVSNVSFNVERNSIFSIAAAGRARYCTTTCNASRLAASPRRVSTKPIWPTGAV